MSEKNNHCKANMTHYHIIDQERNRKNINNLRFNHCYTTQKGIPPQKKVDINL